MSIDEVRARWAQATPGPWGWKGNLSSKTIALIAKRGWGDIVMEFARWGLNDAQPAFVVDGLIRRASGDDRHPSMLVAPQSWNAWDIRDIDHPDARAIAAAPADIATLLAALDARDAEIRALRHVATEQIALAQYADMDFDEEVGAMFRADPPARVAWCRKHAADLLAERVAEAVAKGGAS